MPCLSRRQRYLFSCHLQYQTDLLKSFIVPLICDDSSDDEARISSIQLSTFVYAILEDSCYIFHSNSYPADVRCACSQINDVPHWKSIVAGKIYND
jgi:hypothetical protein